MVIILATVTVVDGLSGWLRHRMESQCQYPGQCPEAAQQDGEATRFEADGQWVQRDRGLVTHTHVV